MSTAEACTIRLFCALAVAYRLFYFVESSALACPSAKVPCAGMHTDEIRSCDLDPVLACVLGHTCVHSWPT